MTFNEELKEYLLQTFPDARSASGGSEVVMRCRFCGDSQSDPHAAHLYIKISGDVPLYNCFKCNAKGILTDEILRRFKPNYADKDIYMIEHIRQHLGKISKQLKRVKLKNDVFNVSNFYITQSKQSMLKLRYINKRLGTNMTYSDVISNKIVLNLCDLLNSNNIKELTRYPNDIQILNDFGIGFLSLDNGFVTIKNLADPGTVNKYLDHPYNTYAIFPNADGVRSYLIPTRVDLASMEPIHIRICEGPFDALSIFYNLCNQNRFQNVYLAICGKSYYGAIKMLLERYGFMNAVFHLYADNDVPNSNSEILSSANLLHSLGYRVFLHRNMMEGEKDMGVDRSRIKEIVIEL